MQCELLFDGNYLMRKAPLEYCQRTMFSNVGFAQLRKSHTAQKLTFTNMNGENGLATH